MSTNQLVSHPLVQTATIKLEQLAAWFRRQPVEVWRRVLYVIAVIWLIHAGSSLVWVIIPTPDVPLPEKIAAVPSQPLSSVGGGSVSMEDMKSNAGNVFGVAGADVPVAVPTPAATPDPGEVKAVTRLNLKLQGVITSQAADLAKAIIAEGSDQELYSIGEQVGKNNGVKLSRVYSDHVVLDNRGKLEKLLLYTKDDFKGIKKGAPSRRVPLATVERDEEPEQIAQGPIRTTARPDQIPKSVGDVVRFQVHRQSGKMVGYKIRPGRDAELFTQLGLKTGDIVTSANGISLDDPKKIRSVYQTLKTATEAQLTVLRGGESLSIYITLETGG